MPTWRRNLPGCCRTLQPNERGALVKLAGGSLGAALRLSGGEGITLAQEATKLIDRAGAPDIGALSQLADRLARITDGLDMLGDYPGSGAHRPHRARALADNPA